MSAENPVLADENSAYDSVGNRASASNAAGSITHNANNELLTYGDITYDYDDNGNMTRQAVGTASVGTAAVNDIYNAQNRLIRVEDELTQTVIAEYVYDPFGRRLWKEVSGVRTYFFYSEEGLIAEYDASGVELCSYGYTPDSTWTTDPLWRQDGDTYFWYHNDHLGTPQQLTDSSGAVVWSAQYTAFGEAVIETETVTNNLRFPGQYYDVETGLHYNFQRYYDVNVGRYVNVDFIGMHGGDLNLYGYAHNNSVNGSDNLGMWATELSKKLEVLKMSASSQDETHETLTQQAFDGMTPTPLDGWTWTSIDVIEQLLIYGNINQDVGYNVLNVLPFVGPADPQEKRRHYAAEPGWTREEARELYLRYLREEGDYFNAYVKPDPSLTDPDMPTFDDCYYALISLGQLSHSWQDYYGHGVTSNAQCATNNRSGHSMDVSCLALQMPIFMYGPPIMHLGSPDNPVLWPIKENEGGLWRLANIKQEALNRSMTVVLKLMDMICGSGAPSTLPGKNLGHTSGSGQNNVSATISNSRNLLKMAFQSRPPLTEKACHREFLGKHRRIGVHMNDEDEENSEEWEIRRDRMNTSLVRMFRCMASTAWKYLVVGWVGSVILSLLMSCGVRAYESLQPQAPPPWHGESVTVDLSPLINPYGYEMEFAAQNEPYLAFWSLDLSVAETDGSYDLTPSHQIKTDSPGHYVVIDFQGNIVTDAVTATGALRDRYIDLFPSLAMRQRCAEFIRGAEFWAFSPDGAYGMKSDTCYQLNDILNEQKGMRVHPCEGFEIDYVNVELWDLRSNERLWEKIVKGYAIQFAQPLTWQGQDAVLIAVQREAYLVSDATGETLGKFDYTILHDSNSSYQQRFGDRHGGRLLFHSWDIAYTAATRWLFCGASETRRVRVFSVDPPHQLIQEVYADQPPYRGWEVRAIRVNGNGRYVILDTAYYGDPWRGPTEVYDVENWERVWYENQQHVSHVTISPNGKKIAFLRGMLPHYGGGMLLEMGDFYPEKAP